MHYLCKKETKYMNHDISKSVSQRGNGAQDAENFRISAIANQLERLCRLHEEESREGKTDGSRFELEQRVAEQYAKSIGLHQRTT